MTKLPRSAMAISSMASGDRSRTRRPVRIRLPLPPLALSLVGRGDARDYVFAGRVGKISAFSDLKHLLDQASGVTGWRIHDLRRTAATNLQDLGIPNDMVQAVLNHAVPGVGGVYLRSELEKQKAEALATWATALTRIVGQGHAISHRSKIIFI